MLHRFFARMTMSENIKNGSLPRPDTTTSFQVSKQDVEQYINNGPEQPSLLHDAKKMLVLLKQEALRKIEARKEDPYEKINLKLEATGFTEERFLAAYTLLADSLASICCRANDYRDELKIFFIYNPGEVNIKADHSVRIKQLFNFDEQVPSPFSKLPFNEMEKNLDSNLSMLCSQWEDDKDNNRLIKHFSDFNTKDGFLTRLRALNEALISLDKKNDMKINFSYREGDSNSYWVSINKEAYEKAKSLTLETTHEPAYRPMVLR